jgi:vacuolar-type H+-ATPase subunit H
MSETTPGPIASDGGTIDALKRIKATEAEWDGKVAAARRDAEASLRRLHDELEATVQAAHAAAEAERARALQRARAAAEVEAEGILAEGRAAASAAATTAGKRPADREDEVLAAVLGSLSVA